MANHRYMSPNLVTVDEEKPQKSLFEEAREKAAKADEERLEEQKKKGGTSGNAHVHALEEQLASVERIADRLKPSAIAKFVWKVGERVAEDYGDSPDTLRIKQAERIARRDAAAAEKVAKAEAKRIRESEKQASAAQQKKEQVEAKKAAASARTKLSAHEDEGIELTSFSKPSPSSGGSVQPESSASAESGDVENTPSPHSRGGEIEMTPIPKPSPSSGASEQPESRHAEKPVHLTPPYEQKPAVALEITEASANVGTSPGASKTSTGKVAREQLPSGTDPLSGGDLPPIPRV